MRSAETRARIFVSCGQNENSNEREIAGAISTRLREMGFDPYVAVQEQSLRGLRENIFAQLSSSEYFLFIDFKREQIDENGGCRGSLFSHQELAIASYLDIPLLAFQEDGMKRLDGMLGILQGNCIPFGDRRMLASLVADTVQRRGWDPGWKNCLILERNEHEFEDVIDQRSNLNTRYFHVAVRNLNPFKAGRNCSVYLEKIVNVGDGSVLPVRPLELKWAGFMFPTAVVIAGSKREFDALVVRHDYPGIVYFPMFTDTSHYAPKLVALDPYELTFCVVSDTFPDARAVFLLEFGKTLNDIRLVAR